MGYISTTHTMAGVYRTWGNRKWNSVEESWDTFPKAIKGGDGEGEETIIPGAAAPNGQVRVSFGAVKSKSGLASSQGVASDEQCLHAGSSPS